VYRLPTDAEWEYACRGGATSEEECSYHFYFEKPTNDISSLQANINGNPLGKGEKGPYLGRTTRVGSYPPNKLGLCDMHGNVVQWCSNLADPPADPTGVLSAPSYRMSRGSDWNTYGGHSWAAVRLNTPPSTRSSNLGFRLARVPSAPGK
jgi:formylglycine-generating enzyme required for sulfatase activity